MSRTIVVKGRGIQKEAQAAGAINPGHLVELTSSGTVQVHGTAASNAQRAFAKEYELTGKGTTDAYAANDNVIYEVVPPGAEVYARLAAAATAVTVGAFLESAGDGTVRILTADAATDQAQRAAVVGVALEAVDNSGGGAEVFILMEAI